MSNNFVYIFGATVNNKLEEVVRKVKEMNSTMSYSLDINNKKLYMPSTSIYYLFPYLFNTTFNIDNDEILLELCMTSIMCLDFCLYSDKIIDNQVIFDTESYYYKMFLNQIFIRKMSKYHNGTNIFWDYYSKYYKQYVKSVTIEKKNHFNKLSEYTYEEFCEIAIGKQALAKLIPASLGVQANCYEQIKNYEKSMDIFAIATQIYDDLRDWKDDFKNRRLSWLLSRILTENSLDISCDEKMVSNIMFGKNYDTKMLELANNLCQEAMLIAPTSEQWIRSIRLFIVRINRLMMDLLKMRGEHVNGYPYLFRNDKVLEINDVIQNSQKFIINQYKMGFGEVKDFIFGSRKATSEDDYEVLGGDIFERTFILNFLLEMDAIEGLEIQAQIEDLIANERKYIYNSKTKKYDCGWIYAEELYGNCPDLDTLSEIIRIASITKDEQLLKEVRKTLDKVFRINIERDNYSSWIIDEGEKDYEVVIKKLSREAESEVNANFVHALNVIDEEVYKEEIEKCIEWLYSQQNDEGTWKSVWYSGEYYCGYVFSKTFKVVKKSECIQKYLEFLQSTQNENGSWGYYKGNPLDTSFALLALLNIVKIYELDVQVKETILLGMQYLLSTVNEKGYWYGCEFIIMGPGKKDSIEQMWRYKSATVTSVVCASALIKVQKYIIER